MSGIIVLNNIYKQSAHRCLKWYIMDKNGHKMEKNGCFRPLCVDSSSAILITILISSYLVITDLILANFALFLQTEKHA